MPQLIPKPQRLSDIDWSNWQAKIPATLLFVIQDGKILLIRKKQGLGQGKINGPGGKLEPGETIEQCAIRELQEELHITPGTLTYHGDNCFQFTDGLSLRVHIYSTDTYQNTPTETSEALPLWFDTDKIPYDEMWEDDVLWIPLMLAGKKFTGHFLFCDDKMLDYELIEQPQ